MSRGSRVTFAGSALILQRRLYIKSIQIPAVNPVALLFREIHVCICVDHVNNT